MNAASLKMTGVIVLVVGLSGAVLLYRQGRPPASKTAGEWQDSTLSLTDSKANTRNIEMYGGQLEVLMVKWQEWFHQPTARATLVAMGAAVAALVCFILAHFMKKQDAAPNSVQRPDRR
jgi:hypothetical protein